MDGAGDSMRSEFSFHRSLFSRATGSFSPRLGRVTLKRSDDEIRISTPGLIISTSRGVTPHLTRDHVNLTDAVRWIQLPFETFLERMPPIPTKQSGAHPFHTFLGLQSEKQVLAMSLRDPFDGRELPPNGNKFINANTIRGVRKVTTEQYRSYVLSLNPDLVIALSDIPFTPPPFSQKRITKSLERSTAWLSSLLQPLTPNSSADRRHPLNIFVHMVGDISVQARRAFSGALTEALYAKDAEQIRPYRCLDDGIVGYTFDLIPLRASILASSSLPVSPEREDNEEESQLQPNRRTLDPKPFTEPHSDVVLPEVAQLLEASLESLSPEKPRIVSGAASPHEVLQLIRNIGVDLFDVGWAQKAADWGVALDFAFPAPRASPDTTDQSNIPSPKVRADGKRDLGHNLYSSSYAFDFSRFAAAFADGESAGTGGAPAPSCPCIACSPISPPDQLSHSSVDVLMAPPNSRTEGPKVCDPPFTRAYVHHLLHTHEMSAHALLVAHNLAVAEAFFASIRAMLARGASHSHHPHAHQVGQYHPAIHPDSETFAAPSDDASFEHFAEEVDRFCATYDDQLRVFKEAKADWISVDYSRGKGRLAREKAKQGESKLATKPEAEAAVEIAAQQIGLVRN